MTHKSILQNMMTEILIKQISGKLSISKSQVSNTVKLLEERSEERRVGKSVDLGGRRIIKKKKKRITK